ncbi:uncharacterized protein TRIVIDRAFT_215002 [Trichoderma virens Gv29-8]|uniref:Uncharacterized protein n=1 Tax=Hypocrea virens (strain Gv29-8 / FGSC 10586) TaxID=413071 RepID=G9MDG4_HYPVG|nr:uncharacterized protein TRIVIDRAFT_215002 [Trichoderma virens Gv29-8]EHK26826.1 hypothetical protein TRIVIDRAFT_215002 [Trichoderma virens Gv29-8]
MFPAPFGLFGGFLDSRNPPVQVEPLETYLNSPSPTCTQCNGGRGPLLSSPLSLSVHVKASSNHDIKLEKGPWEMQAVPKAEGQLIIVAASPACAPRSHGSHRHLDAFLSIDLFAVLETGDGISNPLMSPVLSATRVPETHITHTRTKKQDPACCCSM